MATVYKNTGYEPKKLFMLSKSHYWPFVCLLPARHNSRMNSMLCTFYIRRLSWKFDETFRIRRYGQHHHHAALHAAGDCQCRGTCLWWKCFVKREQRPNRRQTDSNIKLWSSERRNQTCLDYVESWQSKAKLSLLEYCRGAKEEDLSS